MSPALVITLLLPGILSAAQAWDILDCLNRTPAPQCSCYGFLSCGYSSPDSFLSQDSPPSSRSRVRWPPECAISPTAPYRATQEDKVPRLTRGPHVNLSLITTLTPGPGSPEVALNRPHKGTASCGTLSSLCAQTRDVKHLLHQESQETLSQNCIF